MDPMDDALDPAAAEQRGFLRGFNIGLLSFAIPSALWGAFRAFVEIPAHENIFRQAKVPMPGLTLLMMNMRIGAGVLLLAGVLVCSLLMKLAVDPKKALKINAAFLLISVGWLGLVSLAVQLPLLSVLEGIGSRH